MLTIAPSPTCIPLRAGALDAPDVPRDEHGLQIHGVRPRAWSVETAEGDVVTATLCFTSQAFPFAHTVRQDVRVAPQALRITTSVIASGGVGVPISFGFHPYLVLPGVPRAEWELILPARRGSRSRAAAGRSRSRSCRDIPSHRSSRLPRLMPCASSR